MQLKPAQVEVDGALEAGGVAEAAGQAFDPLNAAVDRLGQRVVRLQTTAVTIPSKCFFTIRATRLIGSSRLRIAH